MLGFSSPAPKKELGAEWIAKNDMIEIRKSIKNIYADFLNKSLILKS
jgi:hypothetical protein